MLASEAVNTFLVEQFGVPLEDVLQDATERRNRPALADRVTGTAQRLDYWRDEEGAVTELFEGVLTVDGVRYGWRASIFTDLEGERFIADIGEFKPVDWSAVVRLAS